MARLPQVLSLPRSQQGINFNSDLSLNHETMHIKFLTLIWYLFGELKTDILFMFTAVQPVSESLAINLPKWRDLFANIEGRKIYLFLPASFAKFGAIWFLLNKGLVIFWVLIVNVWGNIKLKGGLEYTQKNLSPTYNFDLIVAIQVMRIKQIINQGTLFWCQIFQLYCQYTCLHWQYVNQWNKSLRSLR